MSRAKEEYKNKLYAAQWEKIPKSWSKVEKIKIIIENWKIGVFKLPDYEFVIRFFKKKMADPKRLFKILPSLSILMKFGDGAVFRSLITNLVFVFPKKEMADPKWWLQYNVQSFS
jgi:hypothetical protein